MAKDNLAYILKRSLFRQRIITILKRAGTPLDRRQADAVADMILSEADEFYLDVVQDAVMGHKTVLTDKVG